MGSIIPYTLNSQCFLLLRWCHEWLGNPSCWIDPNQSPWGTCQLNLGGERPNSGAKECCWSGGKVFFKKAWQTTKHVRSTWLNHNSETLATHIILFVQIKHIKVSVHMYLYIYIYCIYIYMYILCIQYVYLHENHKVFGAPMWYMICW